MALLVARQVVVCLDLSYHPLSDDGDKVRDVRQGREHKTHALAILRERDPPQQRAGHLANREVHGDTEWELSASGVAPVENGNQCAFLRIQNWRFDVHVGRQRLGASSPGRDRGDNTGC